METRQQVINHLDWCRQNNTIPRFIGYFPFTVLLNIGVIAVDYTTIRIMYTGIIDAHYYINRDGWLEQVGVDNPVALDPKEVLSADLHPDGWEPEGLRPPEYQR